ncbi:MAG: hypothetical protein ABFS05_11520 [Bacteroidota bacterium]
MYELRQQVCLLFKNSTEKIYAKSTAIVTISVTESIPDPSSQDIIITGNSTGGKDIEIKLHVNGEPTLQPQNVEKEVEVEIIDAGEPLNEQGVRDAVGSKLYNVTVNVYKGSNIESSKEKEINENSTVIIE